MNARRRQKQRSQEREEGEDDDNEEEEDKQHKRQLQLRDPNQGKFDFGTHLDKLIDYDKYTQKGKIVKKKIDRIWPLRERDAPYHQFQYYQSNIQKFIKLDQTQSKSLASLENSVVVDKEKLISSIMEQSATRDKRPTKQLR